MTSKVKYCVACKAIMMWSYLPLLFYSCYYPSLYSRNTELVGSSLNKLCPLLPCFCPCGYPTPLVHLEYCSSFRSQLSRFSLKPAVPFPGSLRQLPSYCHHRSLDHPSNKIIVFILTANCIYLKPH